MRDRVTTVWGERSKNKATMFGKQAITQTKPHILFKGFPLPDFALYYRSVREKKLPEMKF